MNIFPGFARLVSLSRVRSCSVSLLVSQGKRRRGGVYDKMAGSRESGGGFDLMIDATEEMLLSNPPSSGALVIMHAWSFITEMTCCT